MLHLLPTTSSRPPPQDGIAWGLPRLSGSPPVSKWRPPLRGFCCLFVTAAAERTPAFLALELGWTRLGVGKGSGRRWGRIDEASEGGRKERAFGWGRGRPRPSGRVWLQLPASLRSDVLLGFRFRLPWSFVAEVLSEGRKSDFSLGLKPARSFVAVRTIPFHTLPSGLLSSSALPGSRRWRG